VHNGNGRSSGKRWLLIALLVLGGFWLVNDSYRDGYTDALVQTGQASGVRYYHGGPHFPWGLVILGGIGYIAWRKGAFDRFGGPGGPFGGPGSRGIQRYGGGYGGQAPRPGQDFGPAFRGPRGMFEEWHRQAHEAARTQPAAPSAPPAAGPVPGNGTPPGGFTAAPPPPPPAPEYWATMGNAGETTQAPPAPPQAPRTDERPQQPQSGGGPVLERW
jgi:hypothetical protein